MLRVAHRLEEQAETLKLIAHIDSSLFTFHSSLLRDTLQFLPCLFY